MVCMSTQVFLYTATHLDQINLMQWSASLILLKFIKKASVFVVSMFRYWVIISTVSVMWLPLALEDGSSESGSFSQNLFYPGMLRPDMLHSDIGAKHAMFNI